ncbi:hypothetical protein BDQ12DRAFT_700970 [Crucibulum laeve]|uniref:CxC6 like cysteine cluster associated with KDZ domain-containing protein n=1 Tax=Crucibulum laeve TaxID=68775 RepID=A0A5C3LIQ5_9AGAR|nr:hypothetical protein BDQ12DRAFT_700970 [Crucibulum laeve]
MVKNEGNMHKCSEEEQHPWLPQVNRQQPAYDEIQAPNQQHSNYFIAPCFYCVETICAPCAESPTNNIEFLDLVYPTSDLQPNYVCIDKHVFGAWDVWGQTTRFVVDSYHYINHHTTDYICHKWCNPASLNAFNTHACEQLNAWIGGFQSSVNKMNVENFNWTMHSLLFIHTQKIIKKQQEKKRNNHYIPEVEESDEDEEMNG